MTHDLTVHYADPHTLKTHPDNPRRGNLPAIVESLQKNGQFKPIVLNERSGYIVAGNHTLLGAQQLNLPRIGYVKINVDRAAEVRIMAADNRVGDLGTYDDDVLLAVLEELNGDLVGSGYTDIDLEVLRHRDDDVPDPEDEVPEPQIIVYGAVIEVDTLEDQKRLIAQLRADGLDARPLKRD